MHISKFDSVAEGVRIMVFWYFEKLVVCPGIRLQPIIERD